MLLCIRKSTQFRFFQKITYCHIYSINICKLLKECFSEYYCEIFRKWMNAVFLDCIIWRLGHYKSYKCCIFFFHVDTIIDSRIIVLILHNLTYIFGYWWMFMVNPNHVRWICLHRNICRRDVFARPVKHKKYYYHRRRWRAIHPHGKPVCTP